MSAINIPPTKTPPARPAPPPGEKYCQCGCGETLPVSLQRNWRHGHKRRSGMKEVLAQDHLAESIRNLQAEIRFREQRQKDIEQEVGTNRQKLTLLRQAVQSLQAIGGGGRPDASAE